MTNRFFVFAGVGMLLAACSAPVVEKVLPLKTSAATGSKNYQLAPNDTVSVTVFQEPDMTTQQQIARDGSISFPLIGRVVVGGMSAEEAQNAIGKRLEKGFLVNPQVSLAVTQYGQQTYAIFGQVTAPGIHPIPYEQQDAFTLPLAIATAGGNTRIGNLHNIHINRRHDGVVSQFTVNMLSLEGQQFLIQRGDLVTVQETLF